MFCPFLKSTINTHIALLHSAHSQHTYTFAHTHICACHTHMLAHTHTHTHLISILGTQNNVEKFLSWKQLNFAQITVAYFFNLITL